MNLTSVKVKSTLPKESPYSLSDGMGLYLYVVPTGGRLWRYNYRFNRKQKTMSFGAYPEVSLAEARSLHSEARKILTAGKDPMAERKAVKRAENESLESVGRDWFKDWKGNKDPRYAGYIERWLEGDLYREIGSLPIEKITARELLAMVKGIEARGAQDVARRVLALTSQIFRYAIAHGRATRNPAADFRAGDILKPIVRANHARIDAKEIPELLAAIDKDSGNLQTKLAMKIMAHTFLRMGELLGGRWTEIDFDNKRWNIPKERMKMDSSHIVPLSNQVVTLLKEVEQYTGRGEFIFPSYYSTKKHMSKVTFRKALERMGYSDKMTSHGFRGLASTVLYEHDFDEKHIELQLSHMKRDKVAAAYNHAKYLPQRAKMMQWWSDYLEKQQKSQ